LDGRALLQSDLKEGLFGQWSHPRSPVREPVVGSIDLLAVLARPPLSNAKFRSRFFHPGGDFLTMRGLPDRRSCRNGFLGGATPARTSSIGGRWSWRGRAPGPPLRASVRRSAATRRVGP